MPIEENPEVGGSPEATANQAAFRDRLRAVNEQLTLATLRAHEQADESADRYRDLVEGLDAIVWEANAEPWQFTFVSQRAQTMLGYPVARWLTEPKFLRDVIHPEDRQAALSVCQANAAAPADFRVEYRALAADGRIVWLAMIARPRQNEHAPRQFRGLLVDVGDSIRAAALQKLVTQQTTELLTKQDHLRALATELNLAEHRARTKLATELHDHLAQLLALGRLKLGQAKRVKRVAPACIEFIQQTEEVLTISLDYTRTLVADLTPPVLHEFGLLAGLRWLAGQMKRYDLAVEIEPPESPELSISEDQAVLLFQSVRELLINIAKHAKTGQATVSLQCQNGMMRLAVRDEGCGFDVSCVVDNRTAASSKFGLFSIRERMKALGGGFEMESVPRTGSIATLILPLTASSESKGMTAGSSEPAIFRPSYGPSPSCQRSPQDHPHATIQVLLVDDHAMLRQGLRSVVDSHPHLHVVGEASNGLEAIEAVRMLRPDVVVMDINMPQMNGIEATRRVKEEFPDTAVIGLSVHQATEIAQTMKQAGICAYVTKESAVEALCQAIEDAVSQKR